MDQAAARVRLRTGGAADETARLRARPEELRAETQAAVDAEAYEKASELKAEIERLIRA